MEFCERSEEYEASDGEEEEALSFCDLVAEREILERDGIYVSSSWESAIRGSEDFEFGSSSSAATHNSCPADDLFHQGRLLPLTFQRSQSQSDVKIALSKSNENRILLNEKLQAWRIESQRMEFSEKISQPAIPSSKSKSKDSKDNRSSPTLPKAGKSSLKWQFFTLGLMKTPPMKLQDMRLRQGKTQNGVDSSLKRSVSCNYEEVPEEETVAVKFQRKSRSVRENLCVEETQPRSKGWRILAPLASLNSCKASSNSVINCSTVKKRVDSRGLAEERKTPSKKPPVYADQNSRVEFRRLSFHKASFPTATLQGV